MRHRAGFNKLGRKSSHRKALLRNMVQSLFQYESIKTTKAKAGEVRRIAEKMITRAKQDSVHNRRIVARKLYDESVLSKLFTIIAPRFTARPGGYTRILKLGQRFGDAADMVILELVEKQEKKEKKKAEKAKGEKPKAEKSSSGKPVAAKTAAKKKTEATPEQDKTGGKEVAEPSDPEQEA